jgi:hypothetical protein
MRHAIEGIGLESGDLESYRNRIHCLGCVRANLEAAL